MEFLINMNKPTGKAHLWEDGDTQCTMYSTGGMRIEKYKLYEDDQGRELCHMCLRNAWKKRTYLTKRDHNV